jgi:uncharacterized protein (DUF111 family)
VTFHDLAGLDAIVDVTGPRSLTMLGVEAGVRLRRPDGPGMTRTETRRDADPYPTVVELLRGAPVLPAACKLRLNAARAAILAATVEGFGEMPVLRVEIAGYGAGAARLDFPNVTRVLIGQEEPTSSLPSVPRSPELRLVPEPEPDDHGSAG